MICCGKRSRVCPSRKPSPKSPPALANRAARSINARWRSLRSEAMTEERPRATPLQPPVRRRRATPEQGPEQAPSPERQIAFKAGISAESRAAMLLIAKGFRIIARRWRSPVGEIDIIRSEEHTSELQSLRHLVCRLLLEK